MSLFLWRIINLIQYIVPQIFFIYIFLLTKKAKTLIYCLQQSSSSVILKNCVKWRIILVSVSCFRHLLYTLLLLYTLSYLWCKYKSEAGKHTGVTLSLHLSVKLGSLEMQRWETQGTIMQHWNLESQGNTVKGLCVL